MYSFNPLKLPSVKVIKDDIIEKKQIIDDGVPMIVTTKKKKVKPGQRLIKQYKKSKTKFNLSDDEDEQSWETLDDIIEKISYNLTSIFP